MIKNFIIPGIAVTAIVVSIFTLFATRPQMRAGTAGGLLIENYIPAILYNDGYKSEREIVLSGANGDITTGDDLTVTDDVTVSGGSMTITTTNSATSTLSLGCIQTTATSTLTPVRFVIGSSGATTTHQGSNSVGVVGWQYGTCPI